MGETWRHTFSTCMKSKSMKSTDLTFSVPRRSLFLSWHKPSGVLNSEYRIWGCRVSKLREYSDTLSWILNGWTTMVFLHVPSTLHGTLIPNPRWRWIPSVATLPGSEDSFYNNRQKNCFGSAWQLNDHYFYFHQENVFSKWHFLFTIFGYWEN